MVYLKRARNILDIKIGGIDDLIVLDENNRVIDAVDIQTCPN